jgi:hypothetical protein
LLQNQVRRRGHCCDRADVGVDLATALQLFTVQ